MSTPVNQARAIFLEAIEQPDAAARAQFIARACGDDGDLQLRVERLLESHERLGSFHDQAPSPAATIDQSLEHPGTPIGPYKLLQQIGEGGMGVVYMAEQLEPVKRRVALKIIKPGMDTRQVIARFEAERQALSLMDHPNIAKVLDAGTTESGRPYFVMELVKGQPITQYCDEKHHTPRQRLELFIPVCQAIQHAHQKGIIHRDIKPTNILVAEYDLRAVPKVIDFGVAKATSQSLTAKTMFTGLGQIVGTLEYMSPEQAKVNQLDIDTRSDIYSLGVLLYELLTGSTPLEKSRFRSAGWDEVLRIIREEEPPKPSTRLSDLSRVGSAHPSTAPGSAGSQASGHSPPNSSLASVAALRQTEPARLTKLVRGDLDWIVMKALEKDRNRRYETANALVADLQAYLHDEPVQACPPSSSYRFRKFVRRHKRAVLAASSILLALVAGVIGTTWGLIRAEQQRIVVARQRDELADRNRALQAAHERERLLNERARQAIETVASDEAIDQLTREQKLRPEQEDFLAKMIQYYAESAQEAAATKEERSRQGLAYHRMGRMNQILGRSQDSEGAFRRAVAIRRQLAADFPTQPEFRLDLAMSLNALGTLMSPTRLREKEAAYAEAQVILRQLVADFSTRPEFRQVLAGIYNNLGNLFYETGRQKEAEVAQTEALAIRKQLFADSPNGKNIRRALAMSHNNLGWLFQTTQRLPEAEAAYREAVSVQRQHVAESNQPEFRLELAKYLFNLDHVLRATERPEEAKGAHTEALGILRQLVADYPNRPEFRQELADRGLPEDGCGSEDEQEETTGALGASGFPTN
jgi:serine/threonine protein kinase